MKALSQKYCAKKMREYRAKDPEKHRAYLRNYRAENPDKAKQWDLKSSLKKRYGLTVDQYEHMLLEQAGRCKCCSQKMLLEGQQSRSVCVDHDHKTGVVRGLLCAGCNVAIAHLEEDPIRCELAAAYLRRNKLT